MVIHKNLTKVRFGTIIKNPMSHQELKLFLGLRRHTSH